MPPCKLYRQDCLLDAELSEALQLDVHMTSPSPLAESTTSMSALIAAKRPFRSLQLAMDRANLEDEQRPSRYPSAFEKLLVTHPPILESIVLHLPTSALHQLYHTSNYLRTFLQSYPTVWSHLSFRLAHPSATTGFPTMPNAELTGPRERESKPYALDSLLHTVVSPFGTRLKSLDLDNTGVSGYTLTTAILLQRKDCLEHLSVRGCKNVSLKYHILPFLNLQRSLSLPKSSRSRNGTVGPERIPGLALKSLYTYRCRHHRRRPYFDWILKKKDTDPEATHELINLCHEIDVWTDTAWCPTPSGRCLRRKDYHSGHSTQPGGKEVWVVYDRLWRSSNRIGVPIEDENGESRPRTHDGRRWEEAELGHDGEALGTGYDPLQGEGKQVPAHLRRSHRIFVENYKCDSCEAMIAERCEQCSVRMHCMGCRKTLCASCAFDRPVPCRPSASSASSSVVPSSNLQHTTANIAAASQPSLTAPAFSDFAATAPLALEQQNFAATWFGTLQPPRRRRKDGKRKDLWWAPGATRSPNLLDENLENDDSDTDGENAAPTSNATSPKLSLRWCCLEPMFSGGGGIVFIGAEIGGRGADRIRTAPLPKGQGWEEPYFRSNDTDGKARQLGNRSPGKRYPDAMEYLTPRSEAAVSSLSPRNLCQDCHASPEWKLNCKACNKPICKDHELRDLKMRICGYRDLNVERSELQAASAVATEDDQRGNEYYLGLASSQPLPYDEDADDPSQDEGTGVNDGSDSMCLLYADQPEKDYPAPPAPPDPQLLIRSNVTSVKRADGARKWIGCGAYYCQQFWSPGDARNRCSAGGSCCHTCGVYQCEDCTTAFPPCDCSYCKHHINCPGCRAALEPEVCRKGVEDAAREVAERAARRLHVAQIHEGHKANELAEQVCQFFTGLGAALPATADEDDGDYGIL